VNRSDRRDRAARSSSEVWRDIWEDGWLALGIAATVFLVALFVAASWNIVGAIIESDRVFFAGLSATVAVAAAQWSIVRYRSVRRQQADREELIRSTEDPRLIAAMQERVANAIDNLNVNQMGYGDGQLEASLFRWHDRLLRHYTVFREMAVLRRNLEAAFDRANEYFDVQAENEEFHFHSDQFNVIIRDLNQACGNAHRIDVALRDGRRPDLAPDTGLASMRLNRLGGILRDVTEALERRDQVYESVFRYSAGDPTVDRAREYFRVMTSDLRKAHRTLDSLIDRNRFNVRMDELIMKDRLNHAYAGRRLILQQYRTVHAYMMTALERLEEARDELVNGGRVLEPSFLILLRGIAQSEHMLRGNESTLMDEVDEDLGQMGSFPTPPNTSR